MVDNEDLFAVQLFMLNIPIVCGFVPMRWKQSMYVMLAKDEGHTQINYMGIIQLFEVDLNVFYLSHIFS